MSHINVCQVWFKNRRAKFRKKQRSLQKEQLQKQKEAAGVAEGSTEEPKSDVTTSNSSTVAALLPEAHTPPPPSSSSCHSEAAGQPQPGEMSVEVNVTSPEPSDCESATEDNADREEDEMRGEARVKIREEAQEEGGAQPGSTSPSCKRLNPSSGKYRCIMSAHVHTEESNPVFTEQHPSTHAKVHLFPVSQTLP